MNAVDFMYGAILGVACIMLGVTLYEFIFKK